MAIQGPVLLIQQSISKIRQVYLWKFLPDTFKQGSFLPFRPVLTGGWKQKKNRKMQEAQKLCVTAQPQVHYHKLLLQLAWHISHFAGKEVSAFLHHYGQLLL